MGKGQLRQYSILFLVLSACLQVFNRLLLSLHLFGTGQRAWLALLLVLASLVMGWLALQTYRKASPTGSNLGCIYLAVLVLNIVAGVIFLFVTLAYFFNYITSS
ncbi:MAG: hypothetical protein FD123_2596 [Bacteroidetes bacterium]|nr:MAG: hypothetical protein FD123_2596 [Bacteroidota bacterium]